jgi:hypothetical protein
MMPPDDSPPPATAPSAGNAKLRTRHGINYTLAFVLYADGIPLRDLAKEWKVSYTKLVDRANRESWPKLIQKYQRKFIPEPTMTRPVPTPEEQSKRFKQIDDNRDKIVSTADAIRAEIMRAIEACKTNPLGMDPKAIAALSKAAKDISDMTMVAMGDEHAVKHLMKPANGSGAHGNNPDGTPRPLMIVNLPQVLGSSRRNLKRAEEVAEKLVEMGEQLNAQSLKAAIPPNDLEIADEEEDDGDEDGPIEIEPADGRHTG